LQLDLVNHRIAVILIIKGGKVDEGKPLYTPVVPAVALNVVLKPDVLVVVNWVTPFSFPVIIKVPDEVDWFKEVLLKNTQNLDTLNEAVLLTLKEGELILVVPVLSM
jgi:hypothetical protein